MILLVDLQYFANVVYYKTLLNVTHITFEQYESLMKRGYHNRCTILGADGPLTLSVPLEGGRDKKCILKDARISQHERWQQAHWRGIVSCYNNSPWFEYYQDDLSGLYQKNFTFLLDWNIACFEWTMKCLKIEAPHSFTSTYKKVYPKDEFFDLRNKITPKHPNPFLSDGSIHKITYPQVFEDRTGFVPDLSILDLLFCEGGKRAVSLLSY